MLPLWTYILPILAVVAFFLHYYFESGFFYFLMGVILIGSVLAAVVHAETIAHQVGEPMGSVVLAIAVTVIEVSLIVSLTLGAKTADSTLARDAVFAAVMIILNAMIGISVLIGGFKFKEQYFTLQGVNTALTALVVISILTLILPNYTSSVPGPFYNTEQLIFVAIVTVLMYGTFLVVQNFKHRSYFLDDNEANLEEDQVKPGKKAALFSLIFLLICLAGVVLLAESLDPKVKQWLESIGAPHALLGVIIAAIVLLPEGISAIKASMNNNLQKSLNLSLGSALASIGLTIPTVSVLAVVTNTPMTLGIDVKSSVLFFLSLFVIILSLRTGRTSILQGVALLIIFLVYIFMIITP